MGWFPLSMAAQGRPDLTREVMLERRRRLPRRRAQPTRSGRLSAVRLDLFDRAVPRRPLDVGRVDVISGGAITNATIYALLRSPELSAELRVIEPETAMATSHHPDGPCAGCAHPLDEDGTEPIPTISFVSLWAGILQAMDFLNEASGRPTAAYYVMCYPFGLSGARPMLRGALHAVTSCPVRCRASQVLARSDSESA